jgi:hypothetical protein
MRSDQLVGPDVDLVEVTGSLEDAKGDRARQAGALGHRGLGQHEQLGPEHEQAAAALVVGADAGHRDAVPPIGLHHDAQIPHLDHAHRQEVGRPQRLGDVAADGMLVHVGRLTHLLHAPVVHDGQAVGERERVGRVARDVDRRDGQVAVQLGQLQPQRLARERIEMGERLVEQQHPRLDGERPRQGQAAALGERERRGPAVGAAGQAQARDHHPHTLGDFGRGHRLLLEPEGHVLSHVEVRPQGPLLKHVADGAAARRQGSHVLSVHEDAAVGDRHEPGNRLEHVGLAGVGRAQEGEELPVPHVDGDAVEAGTTALARGHRVQPDVDEGPAHRGTAVGPMVKEREWTARLRAQRRGGRRDRSACP